ncbi:MAG: DUF1131 domain-containing protein [Cyanothece sp. SIO1E1]|nr:DUF1131 domain-containing protein [Cyanothece sp. SIO1E1]
MKCKLVTITVLVGLLGACAAEEVVQPLTSSNSSLALSETGLGTLNRDSNFDTATLQQALPGYMLEKGTQTAEGEPFEVFRVYQQDQLILEVHADLSGSKIDSIVLLSDTIPGPNDTRVGISFVETVGHEQFDCLPGVEELSGKVVCYLGEDTLVQYVYEPMWAGPDGVLPPPEVLTTAKLNRMFWISELPGVEPTRSDAETTN